MKIRSILSICFFVSGYVLMAQYTTVDLGNTSANTTLFLHSGSNSPVPFNLRKTGYSGNSVSYGLLSLDMGHGTIGGGSNLHFRLFNSSGNYKEYGGIGSYIVDNTSGSEDGALTFYTTYNGNHRQRRMTLSANGNLGVGVTNPQGQLDLYGNVFIRETSSSFSDGDARLFNHNGTTFGFMIRPYNSSFNSGAWDWNRDFGYRADTKNWYVESSFGIGTTNPGSYKLAVKGKIRAEEIKVETGWADYVFKEGYDLPTLSAVEQHIQEKGHLINIPSAKEVEENGVQLGEMNKLLLEKIEELTLYTIQQQKEIYNHQKNIGQLVEKLEALQQQINNLNN